MTIPEHIVEKALAGAYEPPVEPGRSFLTREAFASLWRAHMSKALESVYADIQAAALLEVGKSLTSLADSQRAMLLNKPEDSADALMSAVAVVYGHAKRLYEVQL